MGGVEPPTCALRTHRSGQLSYIPTTEVLYDAFSQTSREKTPPPQTLARRL